MLGTTRRNDGRPCRPDPRTWWLIVCAVFLAGLLPLLDADRSHAEVRGYGSELDGVHLGDVTDWSSSQWVHGVVDGVGDNVDYIGFSLLSERFVTLDLRGLDFDADLFLVDLWYSVLASSERTGTEKEQISLDLVAGEYFLRVVAKQSGTNQYRVRVVTSETRNGEAENLDVAPAQLAISEGGAEALTVKLATAPTAPVTVTVSSGDPGAATVSAEALTFTTDNWDTAETVLVEGVEDDDAANETVTVTVTASGGGYTGKTATATVSVIDDETANLIASPSTVTIDEDGTGTFTVKLATQPTRIVAVTVRSDDSDAATVPAAVLAFAPVNWDTPQTVTVAGVADDDTADETVAVRAAAAGEGYAGETATVTVKVTDGDAPNLLVTPSTVSVAEDGSGTFTLQLVTEPTGTVAVVMRSDDIDAATVLPAVLTFAPGNWDTARTVTIGAVADDDAFDETARVTATASGGGYAGKTASVTVEVTDNDIDAANLVATPSLVTIDEDGTGAFTLKLATEPTGTVAVVMRSDDIDAATVLPAVLTFAPGNWDTARTVTIGAVADDDAFDETARVTATASGGGYAGKTASVTVEVTDNDIDAANLVATPSLVTIDEDGTGAFTLKLATEPTGTVAVVMRSDDIDAATVLPAVLTFAPGNWDTARTVTIGAVADDDAFDETARVTATASGGGYAGKTATVTAKVTDAEGAKLVAAPTQLSIDEGRTGTFRVRLSTQPTATVAVTPKSDSSGKASVWTRNLMFTTSTWNTWQTVAVRGAEDTDAKDETVTVTATASGADYDGKMVDVTVEVRDDDAANLELSRDELTVAEAGTETFTLKLAREPTGTVTVVVESDDPGAVLVARPTLTFTSSTWDTPLTMTVRGVADDDATDEAVTLTATASCAGYDGSTAAVTVTVTDDDTADESVTVTDDDTADESVTVTDDDTADESVTVTDDDMADESVTVTATGLGGGYSGEMATVAVEATDDDGAGADSARASETTSAHVPARAAGTAPQLATTGEVSLDVRVVLEGRAEIAVSWNEPGGSGAEGPALRVPDLAGAGGSLADSVPMVRQPELDSSQYIRRIFRTGSRYGPSHKMGLVSGVERCAHAPMTAARRSATRAPSRSVPSRATSGSTSADKTRTRTGSGSS